METESTSQLPPPPQQQPKQPDASEQFNYGPSQPSFETESVPLSPPPMHSMQQQQQQQPDQQQVPGSTQQPSSVEIEGDHQDTQHHTQAQSDVFAQKENQPPHMEDLQGKKGKGYIECCSNQECC